MTLKRCNRKHRFKELNMTGDKKFGGGWVEIATSTLNEEVPKEDTRFGMRVKFVRRIWPKPRVAQITKDTKFENSWGKFQRSFKGRGEIESGSGHAINKIDDSGKDMRQKG